MNLLRIAFRVAGLNECPCGLDPASCDYHKDDPKWNKSLVKPSSNPYVFNTLKKEALDAIHLINGVGFTNTNPPPFMFPILTSQIEDMCEHPSGQNWDFRLKWSGQDNDQVEVVELTSGDSIFSFYAAESDEFPDKMAEKISHEILDYIWSASGNNDEHDP